MDKDRNIAWGFTLFGDDFRQEVGGKFSLMGLYQNDMIFPGDAPFLMPRFVMLIMYYEKAFEIEGDLHITVHVPGDDDENPSFTQIIRRSDLTAPNITVDDPDSERIFHFRIPVVLSPFAIQTEGDIKVRMHYDDGAVLRLGRLQVRRAPQTNFPAG